MPSIPALLWDAPRNPYLAVGIPLVLGTASGALVHGSTKSNFWYNSLRTPTGTASKEAQGIVWPILYAASGFGSYLIAQNLDAPGFNGSINPAARSTAIDALNLYWISLGLNLAWSPLFFGLKQPAVALADLVALTGVVGALTLKAHTLPTIHNIPTSLFFAPYLGYLAYSTYLNFGAWYNNYGPGRGNLRKDL
ncbi:TspO MBR-related protein [Mrakia frigida]|uniref:TspO/MBR family protein n=1 Tax=Mrakia frigida TaxID=29902 RepID=UPI003FCC145D